MIELHPEAVDYIESKFNILLKLDMRAFDCNWNRLLNQLKKIKVDAFSPNDRILICHMDTGYYDPLLPVGTSVNNLIRCFQTLDIPLYLLLFVTNHYGIGKEFNLLLKNHHPKDRPTIIETLLSKMIIAQVNNNTLLNEDKIEKQGLSMMGRQRSHRVALLNFLKNKNLVDKLALSVKFTND